MQESSISEKIKELRTDLKMNQKNFSLKAMISISQMIKINNIEKYHSHR